MSKNNEAISINLNKNQLLAAQLLATGKTGKAVAEAVGVTEETISRWRQSDDFQTYMTKLLIDAHEMARTRLQNLIGKAVDAVEESLDDKNLASKERFAIAIKIIEMCKDYNLDLDCRLNMQQEYRNSTGVQLLTPYSDALTRKAIKLALAGDVTSLKACLERIVPKVQSEPLSIEPSEDADLQQVAELMEKYKREY